MGAEHIWEGKIARCADCIYGRFNDGPESDGTCRHSPPKGDFEFPTVDPSDWCGFFVPVDENQQSGY